MKVFGNIAINESLFVSGYRDKDVLSLVGYGEAWVTLEGEDASAVTNHLLSMAHWRLIDTTLINLNAVCFAERINAIHLVMAGGNSITIDCTTKNEKLIFGE